MRNVLSFHKKIEGALKSYEEIVAMATSEGYPRTNTIAELNGEDIGATYYGELNSGGHLENISVEDFGTLPAIIGISETVGTRAEPTRTVHICYLNNSSYAQQYQGWGVFSEGIPL